MQSTIQFIEEELKKLPPNKMEDSYSLAVDAIINSQYSLSLILVKIRPFVQKDEIPIKVREAAGMQLSKVIFNCATLIYLLGIETPSVDDLTQFSIEFDPEYQLDKTLCLMHMSRCLVDLLEEQVLGQNEGMAEEGPTGEGEQEEESEQYLAEILAGTILVSEMLDLDYGVVLSNASCYDFNSAKNQKF